MRIALFMTCLLLTASLAEAHKVNIFAYVDGGQIYTESYFPDGRAVVAGKVLLYDDAGTLLAEGKTDDQGHWQTSLTAQGAVKVVIEASMGHRNSFHLSKEEIEAGR